MILRREDRETKRVLNCHNGSGVLWCTEMLADYAKVGSGFKYLHENHLEPGASIGEHRHEKDEEVYVILTGRGVMKIDGSDQAVGPGDVCLTRVGHSHSLTNGMQGVMHFMVLAANI